MNSILLAIVLTTATPTFEVQTLDGRTLVGPLVELTADRLGIDTADCRTSLETERLLSISAKQKPAVLRQAPGAVVELIDGSTIFGRQYVAHGTLARITLADGEVLEAPTSIVRTVQLQQRSGALAAEWTRLVNMKADSDLLVVRKDQSIDYHKGVVHDVTVDSVRFDLDGEVLPVRRSKIYGFAYRHGVEAELPPAVCRIIDAAGSQWAVRSLALSEKLQWTTPTGLTVAQPVDKIAQIDFSGGKIAYLSDMKPESLRWTPFFGDGKPPAAMEQFYAPRYDRGFDGGPLQLGGAQYRKGLVLHSRTELVYRLPGRFSRLRTVVGIDDTVRPGGKARLIVRGDGKDLFNAALTGANLPRPVDIDVTDVKRLTIVVDFGDSPSMGGYLLLCDARLSK